MSADGNDACVIAIDVDGRQKYIFDTDKLREMLGASRIIDRTRTLALEIFTADPGGPGPHLFSPVSGEIRAWAKLEDTARQDLLNKAWEICEYLRANGVEFTAAYLETESQHLMATRRDGEPSSSSPSLKDLYAEIARALNEVKNAKPWPDARPACALFAPCQLHAHDAANYWRPEGKAAEDEPRRKLIGFRAEVKHNAWDDKRKKFYQDLLGGASVEGVDFHDLSDSLDGSERGDQYIAFLCADGDGMGNVLVNLDWNASTWGEDGKKPWQRNFEFSETLEEVVRHALGDAIKSVVPELAAAPSGTIDLPLLPQLQGGEDIWVVANREIALPLASCFAKLFETYAEKNPTISRAVAKAYELACAAAEQSRRAAPPNQRLTISVGVAFAKAGYPVNAMVEAAEALLASAKKLRKGNIPGRSADEGCIDWYWIESSLVESIAASRRHGWEYADAATHYVLTTRPWSRGDTEDMIEAARLFQKVPRRKREQLETILRLGNELSDLAWKSWWDGLGDHRDTVNGVNTKIPAALQLPLNGKEVAGPWREVKPGPKIALNGVKIETVRTTPLLDLLSLQHAFGWEGKDTSEGAQDDANDAQEDAGSGAAEAAAGGDR